MSRCSRLAAGARLSTSLALAAALVEARDLSLHEVAFEGLRPLAATRRLRPLLDWALLGVRLREWNPVYFHDLPRFDFWRG